MKEKIVITGGLGYIGSELCKLYSGETRFKNIIVTDYETKIAETLFVEAVYDQLVPIYTAAKLEIINI